MSEFNLNKIDINDPEQVQEAYTIFYPAGSGPLSALRAICIILEKIAEDKGFTLEKPR